MDGRGLVVYWCWVYFGSYELGLNTFRVYLVTLLVSFLHSFDVLLFLASFLFSFTCGDKVFNAATL